MERELKNLIWGTIPPPPAQGPPLPEGFGIKWPYKVQSKLINIGPIRIVSVKMGIAKDKIITEF